MASLDDTYARLAQHGMHQTRAVVAELVLHASDKRTLVRAILDRYPVGISALSSRPHSAPTACAWLCADIPRRGRRGSDDLRHGVRQPARECTAATAVTNSRPSSSPDIT